MDLIPGVLLQLLLLVSSLGPGVVPLRAALRKPGKVGPPLDIILDALNCTAFSIQWKMPRHAGSSIMGYTVFYSEVGEEKALQEWSHTVPLSLDAPTTGRLDHQVIFEEVIGNLKPGTEYRVSVAATARWAKGGLARLSMLPLCPKIPACHQQHPSSRMSLLFLIPRWPYLGNLEKVKEAPLFSTILWNSSGQIWTGVGP